MIPQEKVREGIDMIIKQHIEVLEILLQIYKDKDNSNGEWTVTIEALSDAIKTLKAVESAEEVLPEKSDKYNRSKPNAMTSYNEGYDDGNSEYHDLCTPIFAKLIKERDELKKAPREMSVEEIYKILEWSVRSYYRHFDGGKQFDPILESCLRSQATDLHKELYGKE